MVVKSADVTVGLLMVANASDVVVAAVVVKVNTGVVVVISVVVVLLKVSSLIAFHFFNSNLGPLGKDLF